MASLTHNVNAHAHSHSHSPTSSISESSFSVLTSAPSSDDPFEAIDESSSDDEIVWTANEFDPEEDFILVPQSHPAPHPRPPRVISACDALAPRDEPPHVALSQLSLQDPEHLPVPASPTTPTPTLPIHGHPHPHPRTHPRTPAHKSKPKYPGCKPKGRRSAGGRFENPTLSGHALTSTAPAPVSAPKAHRGRRRRGKKDASESYPSPSPSPVRELVSPAPANAHSEEREYGFGARPFVEESDDEGEPVVKRYEDAVRYITSFLSNPSATLSRSSCTRLTFLQSLIIELGLISPTSAEVPSSLKAAKRFLKARAFINIGEYLSVRGQGLDKVREVMFSSKRELTSELRKKKGGHKADKGWVKRHGLNVLLVSVF